MPGEAIYGSRWAVKDGADATFDGSSVRWDFNSGDSVRLVQPRLTTPALRGTRARIIAQTRPGNTSVGGGLTIDPSPKFLGWALPRVCGNGTSETAPALTDAVMEFSLLADRGTVTSTAFGDCYKYRGCKINTLTLVGNEGLLECTLDIVAKSRIGAQTFAGAALGTTAAYSPYQMADVTLICGSGSTTLKLKQWALQIANNLNPRHVTGSTDADEILEGDRIITFSGVAVCSADGFDEDVMDNGSAAGSLSIVNSTLSTVFSFNAFQLELSDLIPDEDEFILPISAQIVGSTGVEFTIANDVTP